MFIKKNHISFIVYYICIRRLVRIKIVSEGRFCKAVKAAISLFIIPTKEVVNYIRVQAVMRLTIIKIKRCYYYYYYDNHYYY